MRLAWWMVMIVPAASAAAPAPESVAAPVPGTSVAAPAPEPEPEPTVPPAYPFPMTSPLFPPTTSRAQPAPVPAKPPPILSLELFGAIGPQNSRIGLAVDAAIVPQVAVTLGIAESGGDGWSGSQISAAVRGRFPVSPHRRSFGVGLALARGSYGYAPLIGEVTVKTWTRAYLYRVQISTESTGRFHTRWFLEYGGVLNKDDYTCPQYEYCSESSGFIFGGGVAVGFGLL